MDTSFVEQLIQRAKTMLPPATVMAVECAVDSGRSDMGPLLEEIQTCGLQSRDLCHEPFEPVVFSDRVLLRCAGCPRASDLPRIAGIGRGRTREEARKNALYALTLPIDKPNTRKQGCFAAQTWGSGPIEDVQYACLFNRVAYR